MRVNGVTFMQDGGALFEFVGEGDVREGGFSRMQALAVPPGDAVDELEALAERTLRQSLEQFESSSTVEEIEGPGYDNPLERESYRE